MWSKVLIAIFLTQCCLSVLVSASNESISMASLTRVGTLSHLGSKLSVYQLPSKIRFAEPMLWIGSFCSVLSYNSLYKQFQLTIPITVDANALTTPFYVLDEFDESDRIDESVIVSTVSVFHLETTTDEHLKRTGLVAKVRLTAIGKAELKLFCGKEFARCQDIKEELDNNRDLLLHNVKISAIGSVGSHKVNFGVIRTGGATTKDCQSNRWIVFQNRVDNSLSFAQNWESYKQGFGQPDSNYWMGLEQLHVATRQKQPFCQMKYEITDFDGNVYKSGLFQRFEVKSEQNMYGLILGNMTNGTSSLSQLADHNGKPFTTYDLKGKQHYCSRLFNRGGWWFTGCYSMYLNGKIPTIRSKSEYDGQIAYINGTVNGTVNGIVNVVQVIGSKMMYRCP